MLTTGLALGADESFSRSRIMHLLRQTLKWILNHVSWLIMSPLIAVCFLEKLRGAGGNRMFAMCGQSVALLPGFPGMCLRRAFYRGTIDYCSWDCVIGFGAIFTQRRTVVDDHAYVGSYALFGDVHLKQGCLVGSRASVV